jgi:hypothetical protein
VNQVSKNAKLGSPVQQMQIGIRAFDNSRRGQSLKFFMAFQTCIATWNGAQMLQLWIRGRI